MIFLQKFSGFYQLLNQAPNLEILPEIFSNTNNIYQNLETILKEDFRTKVLCFSKDSGGRVLTKGTLGIEYHNHEPQRASTNQRGKS